MSSVLVIPDVHAPYHHPDALDFLAKLKKNYKPDVVVCIGDLGDLHGISRHLRLPDAPGQADELMGCREFCKGLFKLFPKVSACIGNHDERLVKMGARVGIPTSLLASIKELYDCPDGWTWMRWHIVDGIQYQHGTGYTGKDCAMKHARQNLRSTVVGHVHSAFGITWQEGWHQGIFGVSCGCLVDPRSVGMRYAREHASRPVLGTCVVIDGTPIMEPMPPELAEKVRYDGEEALEIRPALANAHAEMVALQQTSLKSVDPQSLMTAEKRRRLAAANKRNRLSGFI